MSERPACLSADFRSVGYGSQLVFDNQQSIFCNLRTTNRCSLQSEHALLLPLSSPPWRYAALVLMFIAPTPTVTTSIQQLHRELPARPRVVVVRGA